MKATTHDGAGKADAIWRADGVAVQEYNSSIAKDGALCTWIPCTSGQKIALEAGCTVPSTELQFDLVVDGIVRNTNKTVRNPLKVTTNNERKKVIFNKALIPGLDQPREAEMLVKDLDPHPRLLFQAESADTVGCVEIRIYALRNESQERSAQLTRTYERRLDWKEEYNYPTYTTIQPTQEIDFRPCDEQPKKFRTTLITKAANSDRAGSQPWLVFRFYYRTQNDINNAAMFKHNQKALHWSPPPIVLNSVESKSGSGHGSLAPESDREEGSDVEAFDAGESAISKQGDTSTIAGLLKVAEDAHRQRVDNGLNSTSKAGPSANFMRTQTVPSGRSKATPTPKKNDSVCEDENLASMHQSPRSSTTTHRDENHRGLSVDHKHKTNEPFRREGVQVAVIIDSKKRSESIHDTASTRECSPDSLFVSDRETSTSKILSAVHHLPESVTKGVNMPRARTPTTSTEIIAALPAKQAIPGHTSPEKSLMTTSSLPRTPMKTIPEMPLTPVAPGHIAKTPTSRAVTPTPNTASIKRKAHHMTPDTANKKLKEDNDAMQRLLEEKRKQLAASREARVKAQELAALAEAKRKADMQRMMEEIDLALEAEHELLEEAQCDLAETEQASSNASRQHFTMD